MYKHDLNAFFFFPGPRATRGPSDTVLVTPVVHGIGYDGLNMPRVTL